MPSNRALSIDTSKPVLVTGATGYIAGVLIQRLLEEGLTVHGTVRKLSKPKRFEHLKSLGANVTSNAGSAGGGKRKRGTLKLFHGDLLTPGSFDEAMAGCQVVFHLASPFKGSVRNPQRDLVDPAVKGTENVLNSVNKNPSVRHVVLTSSVASSFTDATESSADQPLTEECWNTTSSVKHMPYHYSKTSSERKAWEMVEKDNKTRWTLTTILPGLVVGRGLTYHKKSESFKLVRSLGSNDINMIMGAPPIYLPLVDVQDVATAHIVAAFAAADENKSATLSSTRKRRYLLFHEVVSAPEMGRLMAKKYKSKYPIVTKTVPKVMKPIIWLVAPYTGQGIDRKFVAENFGHEAYLDNSRSVDELGMEYTPIEQSLQDMYQQLIDNKAVPVNRVSRSRQQKTTRVDQ